mmetsp:Transcript_22185/g.51172  ORF Transcript_22185/g.51172 Transcript_22185/m.51172 type:complete len:225 (-) Transcript_22185:194-868(-)
MWSNRASVPGTVPVRSLEDKSSKIAVEVSAAWSRSDGIVPTSLLSDTSSCVKALWLAKAGSVPVNALFPNRRVPRFRLFAKLGTVPVNKLFEQENDISFRRFLSSDGNLPRNLLNRRSISTSDSAFSMPSKDSKPVESRRILVSPVAFSMPSKLKRIGLAYNQRNCKLGSSNICLGGVPTRLFAPSSMDSTVNPDLQLIPCQSHISTLSSSHPSFFFQFGPPVT